MQRSDKNKKGEGPHGYLGRKGQVNEQNTKAPQWKQAWPVGGQQEWCAQSGIGMMERGWE